MRTITSRLYGRWIQSWEQRLCYRATNRVVRRFEWGLDWANDWPCAQRHPKNGDAPEDYVSKLNQIAVRESDEFFAYEQPSDFRLEDDILRFRSPVETPYAENNIVHAQWFPATKVDLSSRALRSSEKVLTRSLRRSARARICSFPNYGRVASIESRINNCQRDEA